MLPLRESDEPFLNRNTSAFLYLNSDPNALQVDPSLNISSSGHREKQIPVWSWLPEDVANITSEHYFVEILIDGRCGLPWLTSLFVT